MIIDTHMHTAEYSPDSFLPIATAIGRAREMGIDALCITDHDTLGAAEVIGLWRRKFDFTLILGVEVLTTDGDFVCYGLDKAPAPRTVSARDLLIHLDSLGGAAIAAHPFRNNNRGARELISTLPCLAAVECFNGSTPAQENLHALRLARARGLSLCGAGDAHRREKVGTFTTEVAGTIKNESDLIAALKEGCCSPMAWNGEMFVDAERFSLGEKYPVTGRIAI